jgi:hypothetical protein
VDGMLLSKGVYLMSASRQHSETEISELIGTRCEELLGVGETLTDGLSIFYILLSGVMYKFFIDEGVLFWGESQLNPEEDLEEGESYINIILSLDLQSSLKVKSIKMKDKMLIIQFSNCAILFYNNDDLTFVKKIIIC